MQLSSGHLIYANDKLVRAREVKVGDVLHASNGSCVSVSHIGEERGVGLYNPHTFDGDIVVNGVKTSTYTEAVDVPTSHALLVVFRLLHRLVSTCCIDFRPAVAVIGDVASSIARRSVYG